MPRLRTAWAFAAVLSWATAAELARGDARDYLRRPDAWYGSAEALEIAQRVISYQTPRGGWPKNTDTTASTFTGQRDTLQPTYDNGATTNELRLLAQICRVQHEPALHNAFTRGLDYVLAGQYPQGGWPQRYPPGDSYHRHITLNDHVMVGLLELTRDVAQSDEFAFVDADRRARCREAFARGIQCLLDCQIRLKGELTGWCAQHDEVDFRPRGARAFELPSLSGCETVGVVRILMSVEPPTAEIRASVEGAVKWLEQAQLAGLRIENRPLVDEPTRTDRVVVADAGAGPLWARFYDLQTGQPVFADRDGQPRRRLDEISYERRNGYAWYGDWPQRLLAEDYPRWRERWAASP